MSDREKERQLTLGVLQAIEQRDDISQRHLAQEMGIALGLANSYLKRCAKKGWIKISTAPANRYLYYLTPTGFAEKARLTAEFLSTSLTLFREAGDAYTQMYAHCEREEHLNVALLGVSDLTEIAYLRSLDSKVQIRAIIQPNAAQSEFLSVTVMDHLECSVDAVVVTALADTSALVQNIQTQNPDLPVLIPAFLRGILLRNELAAQTDPIAGSDNKRAEPLHTTNN